MMPPRQGQTEWKRKHWQAPREPQEAAWEAGNHREELPELAAGAGAGQQAAEKRGVLVD